MSNYYKIRSKPRQVDCFLYKIKVLNAMRMRVIIHVDLDAFFASVEQRDHPSLKGRPVVVGADPKGGKGRGVVSTCSYEARQYGIHSAMPISMAYAKCPHAVFLPVDGEKYRRVADEVFEISSDFTPDIEPVSIDEAFLDITESYHLFGTPCDTGRKLKERIKAQVDLTASVGIAPVKMVAKIASDFCKPDGLCEVKEGEVLNFLWPLTIDKLWGVGPKTQRSLSQMGIETVGNLAHASRELLGKHLGENGARLHDLANGIDPRAVVDGETIKSVSHEHTFDIDTDNREKIENVLLDLSERVSRRLRKNGLKGKTLTVKIRLKGFKTYTRTHTLPQKTNHVDVIFKNVRDIFHEFDEGGSGERIRLIGVRVSYFHDPYVRESLFDDSSVERREDIHRAVDTIKDKYGEAAIHRAVGITER